MDLHRLYRAYRDYGWACPPKDYSRWYDLIEALVRHGHEIIGRYADFGELECILSEIDSNGYTEWVRQGRPLYPTPGQRTAIEARAGLEMLEAPRSVPIRDGKVKLSFELPIHSVSLVIVESQHVSWNT